jgi:hypothetical protein
MKNASALLTTVTAPLWLGVVACGDPVTGPEYQGDALATYSGSVTASPGLSIPASLRTTVSWIVSESANLPPAPELGQIELGAGGSAGSFSIGILEEPPATALQPNEANRRGGVAIGYIFAYEDRNENGKLDCPYKPFDCEDVTVGGTPNTIVLYSPNAGTEALFRRSDAAPGVVPRQGWQVAYVTSEMPTCPGDDPICDARPTVRAWQDGDSIELRVVGDRRRLTRREGRQVFPDLD